MRKRTLYKFKVWALIRIIKPPKVWLRIRFREITNLNDDMRGCSLKAIGYKGDPLSANPPIKGLYTLDFGYKSFNHLVKTGQYWNEKGKCIYKGPQSGWNGQGEYYNSMWLYILRAHIEGRIHGLDYVK